MKYDRLIEILLEVLKEVKELMDNNNLELTQLILSSKRNNKND